MRGTELLSVSEVSKFEVDELQASPTSLYEQ